MKRLISRECSNAYTGMDVPYARLFSQIFKDDDIIIIAGLAEMKQDMREIFHNAERVRGKTISWWSRKELFDNLFYNTSRKDMRLNNQMRDFEDELFPRLFRLDHHKVLISGNFSTPTDRKRIISLAEGSRVSCIVLDTDTERLLEEVVQNNPDNDELELRMFTKTRHESFVWPKMNEGFEKIVYISFYEEDTEYFKNTLRLV